MICLDVIKENTYDLYKAVKSVSANTKILRDTADVAYTAFQFAWGKGLLPEVPVFVGFVEFSEKCSLLYRAVLKPILISGNFLEVKEHFGNSQKCFQNVEKVAKSVKDFFISVESWETLGFISGNLWVQIGLVGIVPYIPFVLMGCSLIHSAAKANKIWSVTKTNNIFKETLGGESVSFALINRMWSWSKKNDTEKTIAIEEHKETLLTVQQNRHKIYEYDKIDLESSYTCDQTAGMSLLSEWDSLCSEHLNSFVEKLNKNEKLEEDEINKVIEKCNNWLHNCAENISFEPKGNLPTNKKDLLNLIKSYEKPAVPFGKPSENIPSDIPENLPFSENNDSPKLEKSTNEFSVSFEEKFPAGIADEKQPNSSLQDLSEEDVKSSVGTPGQFDNCKDRVSVSVSDVEEALITLAKDSVEFFLIALLIDQPNNASNKELTNLIKGKEYRIWHKFKNVRLVSEIVVGIAAVSLLCYANQSYKIFKVYEYTTKCFRIAEYFSKKWFQPDEKNTYNSKQVFLAIK